jgi:CelD/BcsL family acetyltransferase involved in cellulose biosynthesis
MSTASLPTARQPPPPRPVPAEARAEEIRSDADLERLRPEWEALWAAVPEASPFQHPAWLLPWWRHVGRGTLACIAVRSGSGALVALAPLYILHDGGERRLFPLGIATTDELDPLLHPDCREAALHCIAARLAGEAPEFDAIEYPQLRPASALLQLPCPAGWRQELVASEPHPVLDLSNPGALPKAMRDNVRHCRARAARAGVLAFETALPPQLAGHLQALEDLHARRWAERGEAGVLHDPAVRAMHREAVPLLHAAGLLRLHALRLDGRIVAVAYCLLHARRCAYYIGGFDPRCAAFSPGTLLVDHAIAQAREEGALAFDFLRGQEAYKYRWGAVDEARWALRRWRALNPARPGSESAQGLSAERPSRPA